MGINKKKGVVSLWVRGCLCWIVRMKRCPPTSLEACVLAGLWSSCPRESTPQVEVPPLTAA